MRVYSESKFEVSFSLAPLLWARPLITLGMQDPTTVHLVAEKKKREEQTRAPQLPESSCGGGL